MSVRMKGQLLIFVMAAVSMTTSQTRAQDVLGGTGITGAGSTLVYSHPVAVVPRLSGSGGAGW